MYFARYIMKALRVLISLDGEVTSVLKEKFYIFNQKSFPRFLVHAATPERESAHATRRLLRADSIGVERAAQRGDLPFRPRAAERQVEERRGDEAREREQEGEGRLWEIEGRNGA